MSMLARTPIADLAPLVSRLDPEYPDAWRDIATCLYLLLRGEPGLALADAQSADLALRLAEGLRAEIGGSQPYLARGVHYELSLRDRQILARFKGRNHDALAREFGVTPRYIYDIVARRTKEEIERRQGKLPLEESES